MKKYLLLISAIVIMLFGTFYVNLDYNYTQQGEMINVFGQCYAGAAGYETDDALPGHFEVIGDDPQFYISLNSSDILNGKSIGGVELVFDKDSLSPETVLPIQLFYSKNDGNYSEKNSVKAELKNGVNKVILPIPFDSYNMFRIDIDESFTISEINVSTGKTISTPYVSDKTISYCLMHFPVIIIGTCLVFWAHSVRRREQKLGMAGYASYMLLGSKPKKNRAVYFDYMRVMATIFVISAHSCSYAMDNADSDWKRFILVCGLSLGTYCNLIYIMLSGALLLNADANRESVGAFYLKRASKVVIPLVAYYFLILSLNDEVSFIPPQNIIASLKRIVTGAPGSGPHLWLIYTIVALYISTPFLRVMVQNLSDRQINALAAVILAVNALMTYLPLFGMAFGAVSFLAGWEGVFLFGYILMRWDRNGTVKKLNKVMLIAAGISYAVSVAVVFADSSYMNYVYNNTPTMLLLAGGVFSIFLMKKGWFDGKANQVIQILSKYSYSILLIHWYVLFVVVQGRMHITALRFGCIGGILAATVMTVIICLIMAVIFDNTVVIVCNVIFDRLVKMLGRLHKNKA